MQSRLIERYFKWPDGSYTITESPKEAVDWFMDGANEVTFIEWVNGVQSDGN